MENEKKLPLFLYSFISIFFIEFVFRIVTIEKFFATSLLYILITSFILALAISWITKFFKEKTAKVIFLVILGLISLWACGHLVYKNAFNVYFSLSMLKLADQVMTFWKTTLLMILKNIIYIIILFIPFIVTFFTAKKINFSKSSLKRQGIGIVLIILVILGFKGSLLINKDKSYSAYEIYNKVNDISLSIEKFGVYTATYLDVKKTIIGFEEEVSFIKQEELEKETPIVYDYNINKLIDFNALINSESNKSIKEMHEYFNSDSGTKQNEYTGLFKDKNLILFMAESYNEIAVSEELTPTLYKLINSSFTFENFYTPVNNSTIGGEFQELTGLFANNSILRTWRNAKNSFPYGVGKVFNDLEYSTYAYHNHSYTFQDRYKYLEAIGFKNFLACRNGLEKKVNCKLWPESDVELINATVDDYINEEKFMVYYATVSGHGSYSWGNAMSKKHKSEVDHLPYSEPVKAYIAAQMELDDALEVLISKLEQAGKLDDTVIALVGDHYPYMLTLDEVNEAASYKKDGVIEINRSNFILYNSATENVKVSKVGSQIDVLPTIYNIFGINYDSRLIIGKDILSTEPGLAIFNNRSWVSDYGKYYANTKKFVANEGVEIPENYVDNMNKIVANKINMSKYIIEKDYYRKVFGN